MLRIVSTDGYFVAKFRRSLFDSVILVGRLYYQLPEEQRRAVEMHEAGHCRLRHIEKRWLCLLTNPWNYSRLCKQQELDADRYAAELGHAQGLIDFLRDENEESFLYPSHAERRQHLKQYV